VAGWRSGNVIRFDGVTRGDPADADSDSFVVPLDAHPTVTVKVSSPAEVAVTLTYEDLLGGDVTMRPVKKIDVVILEESERYRWPLLRVPPFGKSVVFAGGTFRSLTSIWGTAVGQRSCEAVLASKRRSTSCQFTPNGSWQQASRRSVTPPRSQLGQETRFP